MGLPAKKQATSYLMATLSSNKPLVSLKAGLTQAQRWVVVSSRDCTHIAISWLCSTPSLPVCHLKTTDKSAKFETLQPFCFFLSFAPPCERGFIQTHGTESRCYRTGKIYCLQACPPIFQPGKFTGWGNEGVQLMPLDGKAWACFSMSLLNSFKCQLAVSRLFAKYTNKLLPLLLQCCFTSTETVGTIRDGEPGCPPRLSHSSWTLSETDQFNVTLRPHRP